MSLSEGLGDHSAITVHGMDMLAGSPEDLLLVNWTVH